MALIRTFIGFLIAISLIAFAITNRQTTTLVYSPLHEPLELPVYMITLLFMGAGFFLGIMMLWINTGRTRKIKREQRQAIKNLEKELESLKGKDTDSHDPPSEFFPALPKAKPVENTDKNHNAT